MSLDVAQLVKAAGEAAKQVPEHLQEAAFNRAFEVLLAQEQPLVQKARSTRESKASHRPQAEDSGAGAGASLDLDQLDRTAHPDIHHSDTTLHNSLRLLRAVKDDLGIDGLSASTTAEVLVDKFRCRVSRRAVSQALNDAGQLVNRHKVGNAVIFRIMGPGEEYLDSLVDGATANKTVDNNAPARPRSRAKKIAKAMQKKDAVPVSVKPRTSGKVGPATAMSQIYDSGFFGSPRTIGDTIEKLKHDHGRTFKANELSPVLLRWLRTGKLKRTQNADSQYEYTTP